MHANHRYVNSRQLAGAAALLSLLAAALPATARAELAVPRARAGVLAATGEARVAYTDGRSLRIAARLAGWRAEQVAALPSAEARVAGFAGAAILVESTRGSWIRLAVRRGSRWRLLRVADAPKGGVLGSSGLALDAAGRPAVAYALRSGDDRTALFLRRLGANARLTTTQITKRGFPRSVVPPAAAPVLMPNRSIRVVETATSRGATALLWRREGARWWGRVLFASTLGGSQEPLYAAVSRDGVFVAWTVVYPTFGTSHVILSARTTRSVSTVAAEGAVAAALVLGPSGPEIAANMLVDGLVAGTILGAASTELDGAVLGYRATPSGRELLIARATGLEWFALPGVPATHVAVSAADASGVSGRVERAAGGAVELYLETPNAPRSLVARAELGADGSFNFAAPPGAGRYRVVWTDPANDVPYAALVR